jgi:N-acetylglucosaminyl-diphospho-decaprenol L-rhamnosyltransferase
MVRWSISHSGRETIIAAPKNGGYGYGINVGARAAFALPNPPEYLYVINSDASPGEGSLRVLIDFLDAHPDVGVAGSRVHLPNGRTQGGAFRFLSAISEFERQAELSLLRRLLRRWVAAGDLPDASSSVDWVPGTSMMIRRSTFEQVGPFDEKFFLYFEEVDYCLRVKQAGIDIYFVDGAPITHLGSVSTGLEEEAKRYPRYWYESRHRYFLKHHGHGYAIACDAAWLAGTMLRRIKHLVKDPIKPERPRVIADFITASLLNLTDPRALLDGGGPPKADQRSAEELDLLEILLEDLDTYDWDMLRPGLWAVTAHRLRAAAERSESGVRSRAMKLAHRTLASTVDLTWGIRIPETVKLGRRIRLWNSRCMLLNARSIGNDVSIAEDTTLGPLIGAEGTLDELPVVGDRVTIGSGASVLGPVFVESDVVVQPNSVVLKHAAEGRTFLGVPAESRR